METLQKTLLALTVLCAFSLIARADESTLTVEAGRKQFSKCAACHSLEQGVQMMGPSLAGLSGRKAGSVEGFAYSLALEESEVIWSQETLSAFLENPIQYIPGNLMPFGGLRKQEQREALIEYLLDN